MDIMDFKYGKHGPTMYPNPFWQLYVESWPGCKPTPPTLKMTTLEISQAMKTHGDDRWAK